jgi:ribosome maturation factor RimP
LAPLEVSPAVRAICQAVADQENVELVDVKFSAGRQRILALIIDRIDGGVDMDLLTQVSQRVSDELDAHDVVEGGSYTLEVSSAGLERLLVKPADYVRFTGREAVIRIIEPVQGRRKFEGVIESAGNDSFVLNLPKGEAVEIPYSEVKRANLLVDWDAEFKRAQIEDESNAAGRRQGGGKK